MVRGKTAVNAENFGAAVKEVSSGARTVIIVGPPWPRGGTARIIESQISYYRCRGYRTVLVCAPLHCAWVKTHPGWDEVKRGINELGADLTACAAINRARFRLAKYTTWIKLKCRGTALDWIVFTAGSAQLPQDVIRVLRQSQIALVHVNHVFTLEFAKRLLDQVAPSGGDVPVILETHDVQAHALCEKAEINPWTHGLDSTCELIESELKYLRRMKVLIHLSEDDQMFFEKKLPEQKHVLAMPSIDEAFVSSLQVAEGSEEPTDLLFVGQSTKPNRAALEWFFGRVWPLIVNRGYRVKIVGQIDQLVSESLPDIYRQFSSCFVGSVADLTPFYRNARCIFAPMMSGTGISIKTIEALALGKPFVGTSKAYRGMPMAKIAEAGLCAHDTPEDFANAIVWALSHEGAAAAASRAAYLRLFSQAANFASRDEAFRLATSTAV